MSFQGRSSAQWKRAVKNERLNELRQAKGSGCPSLTGDGFREGGVKIAIIPLNAAQERMRTASKVRTAAHDASVVQVACFVIDSFRF
jgi:hypothetical protein